MRRPLILVTVVLAGVGPAPAGAAAVPVVVIEGRGHGHGVGMAQDGAYWMGRAGSTTAQILNQFYPGTTFGRSAGEVRVSVLGTGGSVVVGFPGGGEVRDGRDGGQSAGFPVRVGPGGQARFRFDGRQYIVEVVGGGVAAAPAAGPPGGVVPAASGAGVATEQQPTTTTTGLGLLPGPGGKPLLPLPPAPVAPLPSVPLPTTTTAPPATAPPATTPGRAVSSRALWAVPAGGGTVHVPERAHRYRGVVQVVGGGGSLRLVNHVDVEQYLRGMGEVRNPAWPPAALRAQAIAARTYAMRAVAGGGELCDSQQCQVYLGAEAEYAAMDRAVAATRGQVLMFRRALASTVYSANGGGFSASPEEGFGTPGAGYPYLRPAKYPTTDPSPWSVTVALRDLAARVGYRGRVSSVKALSAGPSGRVLQVTVEGSSGARTVSGIDFDRVLGLKSTMFNLQLGEAATAPPPPPPPEGVALQGLPGGDADGATGAPAPVAPAPAAGRGLPGHVALSPTTASSTDPARLVLACVAWLLLMGVTAATAGVRLGRRGGGGGSGSRPAPSTPG